MITAKQGMLLSNGVFLQEGDNIIITFANNEVIEGKIEYFTKDGLFLFYDFVNDMPRKELDLDLTFNKYIKDIQRSWKK